MARAEWDRARRSVVDGVADMLGNSGLGRTRRWSVEEIESE